MNLVQLRQVLHELIDTCWNVNMYNATMEIINQYELIDTCWNVNSVLRPAQFSAQGINRYMLECKLISHRRLAVRYTLN